MPIPIIPKKGFESREQIDQAYEDQGWFKKLTFDWVSMNQRLGGFLVTRYEVTANKITCTCGVGGQFTYVQLRPTGILTTCGNCRKTMGQIDLEDPAVKVLSTRRIPNSEAFAIIDSSGQFTPPSMKSLRRLDDPLRNLR